MSRKCIHEHCNLEAVLFSNFCVNHMLEPGDRGHHGYDPLPPPTVDKCQIVKDHGDDDQEGQ